MKHLISFIVVGLALVLAGVVVDATGAHAATKVLPQGATLVVDQDTADFDSELAVVKDSIRATVVTDGGDAHCDASNNGAVIYTNQDPWWTGIWNNEQCRYRVRWTFLYFDGGYWAEWSGYDYGWAWHGI